jgi:enolase
MPTVTRLHAIEILDSRGRPTIATTCVLSDGSVGKVSIPSGASTGKSEALELRDGDPSRYGGFGCRTAVQHVNQTIQRALKGIPFDTQSALDHFLIELDGSANKSQLGANAILSVSLAYARASAAAEGKALYQYFAALKGHDAPRIPRLTVNLFSGGKHAGGQTAIQDVLIVPLAAANTDERLSMCYAVYQAAAALIYQQYGMRLLTADEGGLAPPVANDEMLLLHAVEAIERAGYKPGDDVALAIDVASSHFYDEQAQIYHLGADLLSGEAMIERLAQWQRTYPIISIEDGLAEEDWLHWSLLVQRLGTKTLILGDDLLCTHPQRIQRAVSNAAANALLLKVNQIGTLTEALEAEQLARQQGWQVVVSARSGETEDNWLADLAVGWAGDYIKIGSITQSERLAKYNRLLEIEADLQQ